MAATSRQAQKEEACFTRGKEVVSSLLTDATQGTSDAREARTQAESALEDFVARTSQTFEQSQQSFRKFQIAEFVIGALFLVQMIVFLFHGEPYLWPLMISSLVFAVLYIISAALDSRAKGKKMQLQFELLAAKKAKIKNAPSGEGIVVEFKQRDTQTE